MAEGFEKKNGQGFGHIRTDRLELRIVMKVFVVVVTCSGIKEFAAGFSLEKPPKTVDENSPEQGSEEWIVSKGLESNSFKILQL